MTSKTPSKTRYLPRKLPRQSRSKASYQAILDAAARVLVDVGYDKATTNSIAEVAGVSIGTLYEYFPGKEAIYAAVRARLNEVGFAILTAEAESFSALSPGDAIDLVVQARIDAVLIDPVLHCRLNDQVPHYVTQDQTDGMLDAFFDIAKGFLQIHNAAVRDQTPDVMANLAMRTVHAVVENLALFEPEKLEDQQYIDELKLMMRHYLLSQGQQS